MFSGTEGRELTESGRCGNSDNDRALLVFVKLPIPGSVKTRLQPDVSPEAAAALYRAMVEDLFPCLTRPGRWDAFGLYSPRSRRMAFREWLPESAGLVAQSGADLGERLANAFDWSCSRGYSRTLAVGTDTPSLDAGACAEAFDALEVADVVLGPSSDGGYYLIGLKEPRPELFENVEWSTPSVFERTVFAVGRAGLSLHLITERTDVDTWEDAVAVLKELVEEDPSGRSGLAPLTRAKLTELVKAHGGKTGRHEETG